MFSFTTSICRNRRAAFWALAVAVVVPSLGVMRKYTGVAGMSAYAVAVPAALAVLRRWVLPVVRARLGDRAAAWFAVLTLVGLVAGFAVLFPLANSGRFGPGSDTDEAYDAAVGALVAGHYPYYPLTYLGNRIHHLPGAVLMASLFTLLGTSAYQVLFWLVVAFFLARRVAADRVPSRVGATVEALLLSWTLLALAPLVWLEVATGTDKITNGIIVLSMAWWITQARGRWAGIAAVGFGLAVSSRPNFVLAGLPVLRYLAEHLGWRTAVRRVAIAAAACLAVTLPFYLYDPAGFAALEGMDRMGRFGDVAGIAIPIGAALLSWRGARSVAELFEAVALSQAFLILPGVILSSIQAGGLDTDYVAYGGFWLAAAAMAFWPAATSRSWSDEHP